MKYKIGDKVKIVDKRTSGMNFDGKMDKYLGTIMTIGESFGGHYFKMLEDGGKWTWTTEMIKEHFIPENITNHKELCDEIHELYKLKNINYGNSFSELFEEFEMFYVVPRLVEKVNRVKTLTLNDNLDWDDESIRDSLLDLGNYSIMTVMEIDKKQKGE